MNNRVGLIIEAKYFAADASIKAAALGLEEAESIEAPVPTIGVAAEVSLPALLSVGGELTGITFGSDLYLIDGEAAVNVKPAPFVVISAGYRYFRLHLVEEDDEGDLTLTGPFV